MQKQRQQQLTRFRKAALACYFTCLICTFVPLLQSLSVINALPGAFSFGKWLFLSLHRLNLSGTAHGDYEPETYTYRSHRSLEDQDPEMRWSEGCPSSSRPFDPDLKLDVWRPEDPNGQAILYIHGGGWSLLDKSNSFHIRHMLESGYTVVSPQYSLVCHGYNGVDMLDDLVAARRYLSTRAEQWGVDDERVTVVGTSSGGHLALLLAYTHPSNFTNVYNLYGPGDFAEWFEKGWTAGGTAGLEFTCHNVEDWWSFVAPNCDPDGVDSVSPISLVTGDSPRTVTLHGTSDSLIPFYLSEALHARLDELGIENLLIGLDGFDHGLDLGEASVGSQIFRWTLAAMMNGDGIFEDMNN
ncbi:hypothetical protein TrST_g9032 [Triparma strigata]|uniref:BD-FAE-like domain-containing protein n=1 Tax=Triparma strigata TaxID=1606541 RepID=A0A9W6ZQZ7_9STRA|nr:hypothetical protein TrST_g9032 [Triparma strigata]